MKAYLTLLALALLLLACETSETQAPLDEAAVAAAIDDTWDQFVAYGAVGDAAGCASLWTEDGINRPASDSRQRGREEFQALMESFLGDWEWELVERRTEEVLVSGELATEFGLLTDRLVSATDTVNRHMQYVSVFKRQSDDSWLFHRWMAN